MHVFSLGRFCASPKPSPRGEGAELCSPDAVEASRPLRRRRSRAASCVISCFQSSMLLHNLSSIFSLGKKASQRALRSSRVLLRTIATAHPAASPHHATPRPTVPHHAAPRPAVLHHAAPRPAVPHHVTPRPTVLHHTAPRPAVPHHAAPRPTVPHHVAPRPVVPHHVTPRTTVLHHVAPRPTVPHHAAPRPACPAPAPFPAAAGFPQSFPHFRRFPTAAFFPLGFLRERQGQIF